MQKRFRTSFFDADHRIRHDSLGLYINPTHVDKKEQGRNRPLTSIPTLKL